MHKLRHASQDFFNQSKSSRLFDYNLLDLLITLYLLQSYPICDSFVREFAKINQFLTILQIYRMQRSHDFLLPRLKTMERNKTNTIAAYSNISEERNQGAEKLNNNSKKSDDISIVTIKNSRSKSTTYGLVNLPVKLQYVSKSPGYFKKKQRSLQTLSPSQGVQSIPFQKYIDQRMKKIDKQSLMDLAKQGMLKNMNYKHKFVARKKKEQLPDVQMANAINQTKYSSFNPSKIMPLKHSLQRIQPSCIINR